MGALCPDGLARAASFAGKRHIAAFHVEEIIKAYLGDSKRAPANGEFQLTDDQIRISRDTIIKYDLGGRSHPHEAWAGLWCIAVLLFQHITNREFSKDAP